MTTSVLAAGMFSLLTWILPQANGSPIWQLPPPTPRDLGSSSGWTTPSSSWSSSDEAQPSDKVEAEPDQHPGSEGDGADTESNSDSVGGRTLVLGEER